MKSIPALPALFVTSALLLTGCAADRDDDESWLDDDTVEALSENPAAYSGRSVTITGRVRDVTAPGVFAVASEDGEVLVIANANANASGAADVEPGDIVRAGGTARVFTRDVLEQELGDRFDELGPQLGAGFYGRWDLRPMVVAGSVDQIAAGDRGTGAARRSAAPATQPQD